MWPIIRVEGIHRRAIHSREGERVAAARRLLELARERDAQDIEGSQVGKLLGETIKRNTELVDAVATLQGQVDALRKDAAGRKVAKGRGAVRRASKKSTQQAAQKKEAGAGGRPPKSVRASSALSSAAPLVRSSCCM